MKQMLKIQIISQKGVNSVMNERRLLTLLKHPFVVNMQYAFQDNEYLYLAMDFMAGGDLRYHMNRRQFTEDEARFLVACIILALEYLHINEVAHRDIKPQNLVLDSRGYLRLTDFGISKIGLSNDASGTWGYMAPQVFMRNPCGISVDYFSLGVIAHELMTGKRPYNGKNKREIRDQIITKQAMLRRSDVPEGWSLQSADFANKLLYRQKDNRLGANGPKEVKNHAWLKDFPWGKLFGKELKAPFMPGRLDNHCISVGSRPEIKAFICDSGLFEGYAFDEKKLSWGETTASNSRCYQYFYEYTKSKLNPIIS